MSTNPLNLSNAGGFSFGAGSGNTTLGGLGTGGGLGFNLGSSSGTGTSGGGLGGLGGGTLGGLGGGLSSTPFKSTLTATPGTSTGATSTGLNLTTTAATTTTTTTTPSITGSSATQPAAGSSTTSSSTTGGAQSNQPITFKILEDYINKWMSDLEGQEKDFLNQATKLNALDKLMIENGEKIIDLSNEVTRLTNDQEQLEQELDFLNSQQKDLEQSIRKLEDGIEQMPLIPQQHSDTSRIEMYKLLIEVDNQLKSTSVDLKDIITRLNQTNANVNDPIVQIGKILNSHMDSLNWIEENSAMLQNQVDKLSKTLDDRYRDCEPSLNSSSAAKYSFFS